MDIDLGSGTVTFRILYCGPEGATKSVNIRGLHTAAREDERRDLAVIHAGGDRIITFPYTPRVQPAWLGLKVVYEAVAVPGKPFQRAVERLLTRAADAVIFLPDRMHPGSRATLESYSGICAELSLRPRGGEPLPVFIPDYLDGAPRLEAASLPPAPEGIVPILVPVPGDTLEAILTVFEAASASILERTRASVPDDSVRPPAESLPADVSRPGPSVRAAPPRPRCLLWSAVTLVALLIASAWVLSALL